MGEDRKLESPMMGSRMACVSCQISRTFVVMSVILMSSSTETAVRCNHEELRSDKIGENRLLSVQSLSCIMQHGNVKIKTYRITAVASVFYGYETWPLALREEHRLRVFENRVVRKIFLHETKEITGDWRKLYSNELLNDLGRAYVTYVG